MEITKFFLIICFCSAYAVCIAAAEEVCLWDTFNASCPDDQVVFIQSAFYGRMNNSRCYNLTENETECKDDFRLKIQKQFGLKQSIQFKLANEFFTKNTPKCTKKQKPVLEINHQCTKVLTTEVCISESFKADCQDGNVFILSALYGRMRSSRCINNNNNLNCYANVQTILEDQCNGKTKCRIEAADKRLRDAESSCLKYLEPYLEVQYTCADGFPCPQINLPEGTRLERTSEGYDVFCQQETNSKKLLCKGDRWKSDPEEICKKGGLILWQKVPIYVTSGAIALIIFLAIVALFTNRRRQRNNQRDSSGYCEFEEIQPGSIDHYDKIVPEAVRESPGNHPPASNPLQPLPKPPSPPPFSTPTNQDQRLPQSHIYLPLLPEDGPATQPQPE